MKAGAEFACCPVLDAAVDLDTTQHIPPVSGTAYGDEDFDMKTTQYCIQNPLTITLLIEVRKTANQLP
jgi:hypothetical protein